MKRRNTQSKGEILAALRNAGNALSHEMIQARIPNGMDRATIYRVLNSFHADGLVHKIVGDDGKQYFAYCSNCQEQAHQHCHFHFRCVSCGTVECLEQEIQLSLPKGYQMTNFNGVVSGTCATCQTR